jgi:hypothetical protein
MLCYTSLQTSLQPEVSPQILQWRCSSLKLPLLPPFIPPAKLGLPPTKLGTSPLFNYIPFAEQRFSWGKPISFSAGSFKLLQRHCTLWSEFSDSSLTFKV